MDGKIFSRNFVKEKETKGTVFYKETTENNERGWIGGIYILKDKLPKPFPENISITIFTQD
jgi:hypothetical protein